MPIQATRLLYRQPCQYLRISRQLVPAARRAISSTPARKFKEDKIQDAEEIEKAKQEQMRSGEKKEELESQSEAAVGADQQNVKDHQGHMARLQKETAQQKQSEHSKGKS